MKPYMKLELIFFCQTLHIYNLMYIQVIDPLFNSFKIDFKKEETTNFRFE